MLKKVALVRAPSAPRAAAGSGDSVVPDDAGAYVSEELAHWVQVSRIVAAEGHATTTFYLHQPTPSFLYGFVAAPCQTAAPGMFSRYVLTSPSLWFDNHVMFAREKEYAPRDHDLKAEVFFAKLRVHVHRNTQLRRASCAFFQQCPI
jgi:hypothetical protein